MVQKLWLIVALLTTHHIAFFGGLRYCIVICVVKMFAPLPPAERLVPIVGIVATNNGRTCNNHRFGCGNALLMSLPVNGCGVLLRLRKTLCGDLAAYFVLPDGSDGCRVAFAPREQAAGHRGCFLDGVVVRMIEVYTPEHPNRFCRALYHRNRSYGMAEIVDDANSLLF